MNRILCFTLLVTALHMVGCGGAAQTGRVPVHPVSGTVTMFGSPLAQATVAFAPQQNQPTAIGTTDAQGKFQLTTYEFGDGAAVGNYKVVITKAARDSGTSVAEEEHGDDYESTAGAAHAAQENGGAVGSLVPAQYTSTQDTPLTAEIKPGGNNVFTFEIK